MENYIINDFVDLSNVEKITLDNGEVIKKKLAVTKDSFYSSRKAVHQDFIMSKDTTETTENKKRYFGVLSCSDKEINQRNYDYDSWKKTVVDRTWVDSPYQKPILRNHDLYNGNAYGRVNDSFFRDNFII